jgi:hypothetical protein
MDDFAKLIGQALGLLLGAFWIAAGVLYNLGRTASVELGYGLLAVAVLILIYRHRRRYYIHHDFDHFDQSYGNVMGKHLFSTLLFFVNVAVGLSGLSIVTKQYYPNLFYGVFQTILPATLLN